MRKGLVMEGGAMRGMFTAGVIDVLMEHGIEFDGAVGVSAGAVFGCNYKSHQIGRVIRYNTAYCTNPHFASLESWRYTGDLYNREFAYDLIPRMLDPFDTETFRNSPMEFYVVATDAVTGKAIYHKCKDGGETDVEWMRASASMPIASNVVVIGDYLLLDGGIADSIPLRFMEHKGYDRNVVILTQPADYVKKVNKLYPVMKVVYRGCHNLLAAVKNRHIRYNKTTAYIKKQEAAGKVFVIRPKEALKIGAVEHDPLELLRVYELGRAEALEQLAALQAYLEG